MKKTIILILLVLMTGLLLVSETKSDLFDKANELYKEKKYKEALQIYNKIEKDIIDWKLYYNIGNSYYRLKDFVKAKIYYLKAKKLNMIEADIDKNINIVNHLFKDIAPERRLEYFRNALGKIESILSINLLTMLLIFFVFIFNIILFLQFWNRKKGRKKFLLYALLVLFVFSTSTALYLSYRHNQNNKRIIAVVLKNNTPLRSGKDMAGNSGIINAGLDVKIIEVDENWVRIRVTDEIEGWVKKVDIEII